jgi:hypothetical protein
MRNLKYASIMLKMTWPHSGTEAITFFAFLPDGRPFGETIAPFDFERSGSWKKVHINHAAIVIHI